MKTKHHSILSAPVTQSGDQTRNNPMRRRWSALALGGFLFTSIFALPPPSVEAQCQRWDVSGKWQLRRGDNAELAIVNLQQSDWQGQSAHLSGRGDLYLQDPGTYSKQRAGEISGNITGNSFTMAFLVPRVSERQEAFMERVRFTGTIGADGKIEGFTTIDKIKTRWFSASSMKCADATAPVTKPKTGEPTAEQASSTDPDQPKKKKKKKKKKHHHHDDDKHHGND